MFFKDSVERRTVCSQPSSSRLLQGVRRAQKPNKWICFPLCRPAPGSLLVVVPPVPPSFSSVWTARDVHTDSTLLAGLLKCTTSCDYEEIYGRSCDQPKFLYKVYCIRFPLSVGSRISSLAPVILRVVRGILCPPRREIVFSLSWRCAYLSALAVPAKYISGIRHHSSTTAVKSRTVAESGQMPLFHSGYMYSVGQMLHYCLFFVLNKSYVVCF